MISDPEPGQPAQEHPQSVRCNELLAKASPLFRLGKVDEAKPLLFEALCILDRFIPGPLANKATLLYQIAECLRLKSLSKDTFQIPPGLESDDSINNNLKKDSTQNGEDGEVQVSAEEYYLRAISMQEGLSGADSLPVATMCNNFGLFLMEVERNMDRAEAMLERSLSIRRKHLPETNSEIAICLNNIALCNNNQKKYSAALEKYEQALQIYKISPEIGPSHIIFAACLSNIGLAHNNLGNFAEAGMYFERALGIIVKSKGEEHPETVTARSNLALVEYNLAHYTKSEELYRKSLEISRRYFGDTHQTTVFVKLNLGACLLKLASSKDLDKSRDPQEILSEGNALIVAAKDALVANRKMAAAKVAKASKPKSFLAKMFGNKK